MEPNEKGCVWYVAAIILFPLDLIWTWVFARSVTRRTDPLIEAIKRSDPQEVRALLDHGADPNVRDFQVVVRSWGRSLLIDVPEALAKPALTCASSNGHVEIVRMLLDAGAEVNATSGAGVAALECAIGEHVDLEVVRLLIDSGADVDYCGFEPPLMIAASIGRADLVSFLLKSGADVNAIDAEGFTALMEPSEEGHIVVVKLLLDAGIDVNARNKEGFTALHYAKKRRKMEIVRILTEAGAVE